GIELPLNEITPCDLQLFVGRVAGKADDLHAVAERAGYRVEHIGGGDEDHPAQIERHAEIIVPERAVLLGIKHFEQGGGRVTVDASAELVDLVEHQHAVARPCLSNGLNDVARQSADVGATVAADFGLIMHATAADALELAAHGTRD